MKTLGPATKAALARIVSALPYLRSDEAGVPTAHKGFWQKIKAKYAAKHYPEGASDPLHDAALAHGEEEVAAALEKDEAEPLAAAEPAPILDPLPEVPTPVVPVESSTLPPGDFPAPAPTFVSEPVPEKEGE